MHPFTGLSIKWNCIPLENRTHLPFGQCEDYANMAATIMRSHGIPVAIDFTPQWAKRSLGHIWNVLMSDDGRLVPFGGISSHFGELHKYKEKMPKVYRRTFSSNEELLELNAWEEEVPGVFQNVFFRDVTKETISCSDVNIKTEKKNGKYAYLLCFDNYEWVPVAFGKISKGYAKFKDVGLNIVYLPAIYHKGSMIPISDPFLLDYKGKKHFLSANFENKHNMKLDRKYPVMEYSYEYIPRLKDGEFQASNDYNFSSYYVVHHIQEGKAAGQCIKVPDSIPPCQYWRYTSYRRASFCSIAEIMLFSDNDSEKLEGKVIGTEGSWGNNPEKTRNAVFDGNILTAFDAPEPEGCWVGIDFGQPKKVDHIIYYGRGDGNSVELGDIYELLYWYKGKWESMGRQKAIHPYVEYNNVPSNTLYLLKNLTKGIDERIFTYEDNRQIWW